MKISSVNLGEQIASLLAKSRKTKAQLAEYLGIKAQNVNRDILDKQSLDTEIVRRVSEFFDYNLFSLFLDNNQIDYSKKEVKARIIIEMGAEKQEKAATFIFGENRIELK